MAVPFEIRKVRLRDLDRILEIERASFGKESYDRNLFAEYFHKCGDLFLGAGRRERIWGYLIACRRGDKAEIISIAVDPPARRGGVASALMGSLLRRLRLRRVARISLMVKTENREAQAFYAKYGFQRLRLVREYYEDGSDGWLMSKKM